jgi:TonB family protein
MKLMPIAMIIAAAIFCSTIRNKIDPTPTPLPTLGSTPVPPSGTPMPVSTAPPTPVGSDDDLIEPSDDDIQTISGGVLNDKAKRRPAPEYPPAAKAVRASGSVTVEVLVNEKGKVVAAVARSGHPLLRSPAVKAAMETVFDPTILSGKPVKVKGVLTFDFAP